MYAQNADGTAATDPIQGGCHPTQDEALQHMRALYANVPDAARVAATTCACGGHGPQPPATDVSVAPHLGASTAPMDEPYPVPPYPPRSWFYERPDWFGSPDDTMRAHLAAGGAPEDAPIQKLQVDEQGRVAGYFHDRDQCLIHNHRGCPKASLTGHAAFHQSHLVVEDGGQITVGIIGNVGGHANERAPISVAQAHYADPNAAVVSVRAYDDEYGSYILGAVVPWATHGDVARARLHPLSGDWRHMPAPWWQAHGIPPAAVASVEGYDSIGPTFVNRAGLPLVRRPVHAALEDSMSDTAPVVVHQHFHDAPPGPQAMVAAPDAMLAADAPPPSAPATSEPTAESATEASDVDALKQIAADHESRIAALEDAMGQMMDSHMAALDAEAAALQLPERQPPHA